jgi:riboflavin biosynthesis pyrimidine reductase
VEVLELPLDSPLGIDPGAVVALLRARGLNRILIEGGGVTVSRFLQAGMLDRLHVSVAPLILGSGRPSFTLPEIETLDQGLRPPVRHFRLGTDLLFDLDLSPSRG